MYEVKTSTNINHYKNLKYELKNFKRVHIDSSFVLVFRYEQETNTIIFEDIDHHDNIYEGKT